MPALPRAFSLSRIHALPFLALLVPLAPATAFAAVATVSQPVNLRSGPATSYGVTGKLQAGEAVDVRQCEGTFCQVVYNGTTGWISASFLTRGGATPSTMPAAAPSTPQIIAATPRKPAPITSAPTPLPPVAYTATPGTAPGEPQIAVIAPQKPAPAAAPRPTALPPAYTAATASSPAPQDSADAAEDGSTPMSNAPRPKVDIPGDAMAAPGDDGDVASAVDSDDDAVAADDDDPDDATIAPPSDFRGRDFAPRGLRRDFASLGAGPARACFVDAQGGNGFCVREGERIAAPGRWSQHAMLLRNPQRLNVTVCAAYNDCYTYVASGPVLVDGRPIASISVAAPGY